MIAKKIANPEKSTTVDRRIAALVAYVRAPETENMAEKCTYYGARGMTSVDAADHAQEMTDLARAAHRSADPIIHYVLSWQAGEHPTPTQIDDAIDIVTAEFDELPKSAGVREDHTWRDHQMVYGLHEDTDHDHVHLVVNRVDPQTDHAIRLNRGFDVDAGIRAAARIEHAQGWAVEANKRWRVTADGSVERAFASNRDAPRRASQKDLRRERETGVPSATRIAIDRALPAVARATTWAELHGKLDELAMRYVRSGAGAVIMVGDTPVRASQVDRAATLGALTKRLGAFAPGPGAAPEPPHPNDVSQIIAGAQTWPGLHEALHAINVTYERTGTRAVVRSTDGTQWNASDLGPAASVRRLEDRLGRFVAGPAPAAPAPEARPTPGPAPTAPDPKTVAITIKDATTWTALHTALRAIDAEYNRKGSGAVIRAGDTVTKASQVSRAATLAQLERRLGPFEPAPAMAKQPATGHTAKLRAQHARDLGAAVLGQQRDTPAAHREHQKRLAAIDDAKAADDKAIARYFPRPAPVPEPAPADDPQRKPDDDATRAAAQQALDAQIVHDAMTLVFEKKARRERIRENHRYRQVLTQIRRAYERATTFYGWLLEHRHLTPARGWDDPQPDATLQPAKDTARIEALPPRYHDVPDHVACTVGRRVDYRDQNDDLAAADLGTHIIMRQPNDPTRRLAGLRLAAAKWANHVMAAALPTQDETRVANAAAVRPIGDIHAEIRQLKELTDLATTHSRGEIEKATWELEAPQSWDGDVDRPRNWVLRGSTRAPLYSGTHTTFNVAPKATKKPKTKPAKKHRPETGRDT